jgi:monomeric sarcosine oxidase
MAKSIYDVIVLGTGGVGSAAAYQLAQRGAKVLGIDQFPGGHDRGSSHGETRVIRQAYFEHSDYVPLLLRAYELWRELEQEADVDLLHQVGLLQVGPPDGLVVCGVLEAARLHRLKVESLSRDEIPRRFPGFRAAKDAVGVFEPAAGYLRVERCVLTHLAAAKARGAEFRFGITAQSWKQEGESVRVVTSNGAFVASKLIVTAGPWAPKLLSDVGVPLVVRRKHLYWFPTSDPSYHESQRCPTYLYELPHGVYYGFPQIDELGVKVAEHSGGTVVEDPTNDGRPLDPADLARVEAFLAEFLPGVGRPMQRRSVCFYTLSPDEHFLVDRHPRDKHVLLVAGLSGHGFKFTSVLGEVLAQLSLEDQTKLPIEFLSLRRFRHSRPAHQA